jgi:hypothetical protein
MHAVSLTLHAKYDTACMIDGTILMALAAFKGNIYQTYVPVLSYPTTTKIYEFKGATKTNFPTQNSKLL